ncbi:hypothetical protein BPTFM16_00235 [Altererythrobacter insulae]|nr:hypothetical protein BPTFM16_00235 [Altererythrobacter insulae]
MTGADEDKAKERYMMLNLIRFGGLAMIMVAIYISQKVQDVPIVFPIVLAFAGMASFFFGPRRLASQWKSEDK